MEKVLDKSGNVKDLLKISMDPKNGKFTYTLSFPPNDLKTVAAILKSMADARRRIFRVVKEKTGKSVVGYHDVHPVLQKIDELSRKKPKEERERFMKDMMTKAVELFGGA